MVTLEKPIKNKIQFNENEKYIKKVRANGVTCKLLCWHCLREAGVTPPANRTHKHRDVCGNIFNSSNGFGGHRESNHKAIPVDPGAPMLKTAL